MNRRLAEQHQTGFSRIAPCQALYQVIVMIHTVRKFRADMGFDFHFYRISYKLPQLNLGLNI